MKTKKGDFVELEYTGMLKDSKIVFDTTSEKVAKENGIFDEEHAEQHEDNSHYHPIIVCIGQGQVIKGLDKQLEDREVGVDCSADIAVEDAFGKKNAKLLRMVPSNVFTKQQIRPFPGLQINMDGVAGTIVSVTGGRTIVDFNHPLSGKELIYQFKILKIVEEPKEKLSACASSMLNLHNPEITEREGAFIIKVPKLMPEELEKKIKEELAKLTGVEKINFEEIKETELEAQKNTENIKTPENKQTVKTE